MRFVGRLLAFASPRVLRARGILGINGRNADYVLLCNERRFYPRVDDKIRTKEFARRAGVPVPETYAVIERHGDVRRLATLLEGRSEFVMKPARGAAGRGVLVVTEYDGRTYATAGGDDLAPEVVQAHVSTTLSGLFSLGGQFDRVLVEQRIVRHPVYDSIATRGTPDIRVVLYRGVPVMAMTRLPTQASRGRANLHQGAIGAGIDLVTGVTSGGVSRNHAVSEHPDTGASIGGIETPFWERVLESSVRLAAILQLGYVGIDFVIDAQRGPVVLEANARPGLAIQVANGRGLLPRLRLVDARPLAEPAGLLPELACL